MKETVNLSSMAADSSAALRKLARDVKELKQLLEMRALRDNSREVVVHPRNLPDMDVRQYSSRSDP
ncbi:MAG TPA: hypothetical protein VK327_04815 [Candidatus Paceibacterota bacterium]|nr:hypothetical protein [Candidatus Paceibacterota bacterium]